MSLLRRANPTDAGSVGRILSEFIDTTPWMPRIHTRAEDVAHAGAMIARGWVTVAECDGQVAGFCACHKDELNALYVGNGWQGQGIGASLVAQMQKAQPRIELWTFQANTRAQAFYVRHGFIETARTQGQDNDEKLPDIRFEWQREAR